MGSPWLSCSGTIQRLSVIESIQAHLAVVAGQVAEALHLHVAQRLPLVGCPWVAEHHPGHLATGADVDVSRVEGDAALNTQPQCALALASLTKSDPDKAELGTPERQFVEDVLLFGAHERHSVEKVHLDEVVAAHGLFEGALRLEAGH